MAIALRGKRTIACLSMHKTSSVALTVAMQNADKEGVRHSHFIGPLSIGLRRQLRETHVVSAPDPLWEAELADPEATFTLVTCVRDPISQYISTYFQYASSSRQARNIEVVLSHDAFIMWCEQFIPADYATLWLDDNLKSTFGFDFRLHPFDLGTRSLRYDSERLRLLCLRQEDAADAKEIALGWLFGRETISIPRINSTSEKSSAQAYKAFVASFRAPASWINQFYDTDAICHFYSSEERAAFKARWS